MLAQLLASAVLMGVAFGGEKEPKNVYSFTMKDIDGKAVKLDKFKGKTLLFVNVASKCGNTPQYKGLESLFEKYEAKGFVVLGFPANNFGSQEPGSEAEIKEFCTSIYNVKFPMFSKISVKGNDTHPLYKWLISHSNRKDDVEWNFAKFLVGRDGKVKARFTPGTQPDDKALVAAIEKEISQKP